VNVLVVAPHMDDEVLGCGGTIARHVAAGDAVSVCIVANRAYEHRYDPARIDRENAACRAARDVLGYDGLTFLDLPDERLDAATVDVLVPLEKVFAERRPDRVYLPHAGDPHQDHPVVFRAGWIAARAIAPAAPRTVLGYEVPSATEQAPPGVGTSFEPNVFVSVAEVLDAKLAAWACYEVEARAFPHPRSPEAIRALAAWRGAQAHLPAAEAFMLLRDRWD